MFAVAARLNEYQRLVMIELHRNQEADPVTHSDGQSAKALRIEAKKFDALIPTYIEARPGHGQWGDPLPELRGARYRLTETGRRLAAYLICHGASLPTCEAFRATVSAAVRSTGRGPYRPLQRTPGSATQTQVIPVCLSRDKPGSSRGPKSLTVATSREN